MSGFRCPQCGSKTRYTPFTGGNEYTCEGPEQHDGIYPATGRNLPRATLLRTTEGTARLRAQMYEELARRAKEAIPEQATAEISTDEHG